MKIKNVELIIYNSFPYEQDCFEEIVSQLLIFQFTNLSVYPPLAIEIIKNANLADSINGNIFASELDVYK